MEESFGARATLGLKCCSMCTNNCIETHQDFGRSEVEKLFLSPSFYIIVKRDDTSWIEFLRIPIVFAEDQNFNKVGDSLQLKGLDGYESTCTKLREQKDCVLYKGFRGFVEHHLVKAGDLLVFYLISKSNFLVRVYDKSGIDKVFPPMNPSTSMHKADPKRGSPSRPRPPVEDAKEDPDKDSVEAAADLFVISRGKEPEVNTGEATMEGSPPNPPEPPERSLARREAQVVPLDETLTALVPQPPGPLRRISGRKDDIEDAVGRQVTSFVTTCRQKREATRRQNVAAIALLEELKHPSKLIFLSENHVSKNRHVYLSNLPLPEKSTLLTVGDQTGGYYVVKLLVQAGRTRLALGWDQFARDHNLQVGDACIFEVLSERELSVHIFYLKDFLHQADELQQPEDHGDDLHPSGSAPGQSSNDILVQDRVLQGRQA